jgi:hypothetical protein
MLRTNEMTVTRWRRYGNDRLYVAQDDGVKIGYWDLIADEGHPTRPELLPVLEATYADWLRTQSTRQPRPEVAREVPATSEGWRDLTLNRPGAEARERAIRLKEAAPMRTLIARLLLVHTDERAWRIGAEGEALVAEQFARLAKKDPRWWFLHAIPVGARGSDIDHVAIGPGGVFTINTKHHPGAHIWVGGDTFLVNGQRQPYIRNSRHEAARASRLLSEASGIDVRATGIVVPVNARDVTVKEEPEDVRVVPRRQVAKWLRRRPVVLDEPTIVLLHEAARRSTTWVS